MAGTASLTVLKPQAATGGNFFLRTMPGITQFFSRNAVAYMFLLPWLLGFFSSRLSHGLSSAQFHGFDFTHPATQWIGLATNENVRVGVGPIHRTGEVWVTRSYPLSVVQLRVCVCRSS